MLLSEGLSMEDQISRTNEDSWSKDFAKIYSMLQELVATSKPTPIEFQRFYGENPKPLSPGLMLL